MGEVYTFCSTSDYSRQIFVSIDCLRVVSQLLQPTVKRHFYARKKFMQMCQNGPLDKFMRFLFMRFLFMHSSALCIVTYGAIKIYAVQIYVTCA